MLSNIFSYVSENPGLILGNFFGLVATVFCFITYQASTPKKTLILNSCIVGAVIISYAFLGAWSGMALNFVCLFRNISYALADKVSLFRRKAWSYVLAVVLGGIGALSWQGPISLLAIIPLMVNTVFLSLGSNKKLRLSILATSSTIIIYDFVFKAYLAIAMEALAIISSAIALYRYRNQSEQ